MGYPQRKVLGTYFRKVIKFKNKCTIFNFYSFINEFTISIYSWSFNRAQLNFQSRFPLADLHNLNIKLNNGIVSTIARFYVAFSNKVNKIV